MRTEAEINACIEELDRRRKELDYELATQTELSELDPNLLYEEYFKEVKMKILAVRAQAAALDWVLQPSGGYIFQSQARQNTTSGHRPRGRRKPPLF